VCKDLAGSEISEMQAHGGDGRSGRVGVIVVDAVVAIVLNENDL